MVALLTLFSWCLVMVERFFLAVPWGCLQFVIEVFPDHTHLNYFWWNSRQILNKTTICFKCNKEMTEMPDNLVGSVSAHNTTNRTDYTFGHIFIER